MSQETRLRATRSWSSASSPPSLVVVVVPPTISSSRTRGSHPLVRPAGRGHGDRPGVIDPKHLIDGARPPRRAPPPVQISGLPKSCFRIRQTRTAQEPRRESQRVQSRCAHFTNSHLPILRTGSRHDRARHGAECCTVRRQSRGPATRPSSSVASRAKRRTATTAPAAPQTSEHEEIVSGEAAPGRVGAEAGRERLDEVAEREHVGDRAGASGAASSTE